MWKIFGKKNEEAGNHQIMREHNGHQNNLTKKTAKPLFPAKRNGEKKLKPEFLSQRKNSNGNKTYNNSFKLSGLSEIPEQNNLKKNNETLTKINRNESADKKNLYNHYEELEFFFLKLINEYPQSILLAGIKPLNETKVIIFEDKYKKIDFRPFFQHIESVPVKLNEEKFSKPEYILLKLTGNKTAYIHFRNKHIVFTVFDMENINTGIIINIIAKELNNFKNL